jgi:hypothetical protein
MAAPSPQTGILARVKLTRGARDNEDGTKARTFLDLVNGVDAQPDLAKDAFDIARTAIESGDPDRQLAGLEVVRALMPLHADLIKGHLIAAVTQAIFMNISVHNATQAQETFSLLLDKRLPGLADIAHPIAAAHTGKGGNNIGFRARIVLTAIENAYPEKRGNADPFADVRAIAERARARREPSPISKLMRKLRRRIFVISL